MTTHIPARVGLQQRVLPTYRTAFLDLLAQACAGGLSVYAGAPRPGEALGDTGALRHAQTYEGQNLYLCEGTFAACYQRGLTDWLAGWQPDVLIVEANPRYLSTPKAAGWMHERGRKVIGWGLGAPPGTSFWRKLLRERFLTQFDALLTYSQSGAEQYRQAGFPAERIFVAPNAVAPRPVAPPPMRPDSPTGRLVVLFVGRLQARKRVDLLLRACARLPESLQPRLVIVGDGPERASLEVAAASTYPRTEFMGEQRGPALVPCWEAADLFVLPGTGGLAVQEAMSMGLPVMAAEADGTQADLVRPGNGWSLRPGDEDDLTAKLAEALADPTRLRRMGQESYRIVAEEINLERMVTVFAQAIAALPAGDKHG
jgi:glycosyltransferase involved in cell wall biosynthesis